MTLTCLFFNQHALRKRPGFPHAPPRVAEVAASRRRDRSEVLRRRSARCLSVRPIRVRPEVVLPLPEAEFSVSSCNCHNYPPTHRYTPCPCSDGRARSRAQHLLFFFTISLDYTRRNTFATYVVQCSLLTLKNKNQAVRPFIRLYTGIVMNKYFRNIRLCTCLHG